MGHKTILLPWLMRLVFVALIVAGFNYWLHWHANDAFANHPNRYAIARHLLHLGSYTGIRADVWTGDPWPIPSGPGTIGSGQPMWAANVNYCGGFSWVETNWFKKNTEGYKYKFVYKVPYWGCAYIEANGPGAPLYNSWHNYQLDCSGCPSLNIWYLNISGVWSTGTWTGWANGTATYLEAGGEVLGHYTGVGMQGASDNLQYKTSGPWSSFFYANAYKCDFGYKLLWNGGPDFIYDYGYTGRQETCP